jgi:carbon monoxide dehydrogenase subunit G
MATYLPRELGFAETAPVIFESSETVAGTPDEIWAVLCDHERWPEWMGRVRRVRPTSTPPSGVGSTREVVLEGGLSFQEVFIAWDEPEVWAFTATEGPPVARGLVERVTLEPLDDTRTQVTYRMAVEPRPGWGLVVKAARRGVEPNLRRALQNLSGVVAGRRS